MWITDGEASAYVPIVAFVGRSSRTRGFRQLSAKALP